MLKKVEEEQQELEFVTIASLVPEGHLLRKGDRSVDFSFIRERVKHLYCEDNGRPALGPVVLFKLLLLSLSDPDQCRQCLVRHKCTQSSNATKVVTRHVWESSREQMDQRRLHRVGKRIYKRRKEMVERSFADAKQLHGHRYARMRGLAKVQQQCLLAAAAQNIKKIALPMTRNGRKMPISALETLLYAYINQLRIYERLLDPTEPLI